MQVRQIAYPSPWLTQAAREFKLEGTAKDRGRLDSRDPEKVTYMHMRLRTPLPTIALLMLLSSPLAYGELPSDEVLYNGIRLTSPWPPIRDSLTLEPPPDPPYLQQPPAVIPIDIGRQLFVDDFLIEETDLKRNFHTAQYHPNNPVLKPDTTWEKKSWFGGSHPRGQCSSAMPFSDGVWYDPQDKQFKMWYLGGYEMATCYATSKDGIHWHRPSLDVVPGTNIVHPGARGGACVWLDHEAENPKERFKMIRFGRPRHPRLAWMLSLHFSADGIHWEPPAVQRECLARTTFFYNPFRQVWSISKRHGIRGMESLYKVNFWRARQYWEDQSLTAAAMWSPGEERLWVGADRLDEAVGSNEFAELYALDVVAYESLMLGAFSVLRGRIRNTDRPKINEIVLGYSRDGWHWTRPDRQTFIGVSEHRSAWNWGNVQSVGGCCLVVGDELRFYVSGRTPDPRGSAQISSTGLATLRRDGFASMHAGNKEGQLTTRPLKFAGRHMFVNVDADDGQLRVEVLNEAGKVIAPFNQDNCKPIRVDKTLQSVHWKGTPDLSALSGQPVRFRFYLTGGDLYSFWVTPHKTGASHGYVAAGGPGFTGSTDTVGSRAK